MKLFTVASNKRLQMQLTGLSSRLLIKKDIFCIIIIFNPGLGLNLYHSRIYHLHLMFGFLLTYFSI